MNIALFYHSLLSDWNHGNAHFLRGVCSDLLARGHMVRVYEPRDSWSRQNLIKEHGTSASTAFLEAYPQLRGISQFYEPGSFDVEDESFLRDADLIIAHEWNDHDLIADLGRLRARHPEKILLFHDTHHRAVSDPEAMRAYDLKNYDGVLAFGKVLREIYQARGWVERCWSWHEAADTRVFQPLRAGHEKEFDLVWIGNWGDDERTEELREFLIEPVRELGLNAVAHGVRYPAEGISQLAAAGIEYRGWLPNYRAPDVFARARVTVHIPRRPYTQTLPGIPTIRPFEALACGIPLVCAPWDDAENLFHDSQDYLTARDGREMTEALQKILQDPQTSRRLSRHGLETIQKHHTCRHRVNELMEIIDEIRADRARSKPEAESSDASATKKSRAA